MHKELCDAEGKISKALAIQKSRSLAKPINEGYAWLRIRYQVDELVPELSDFLQEAGNRDHWSQRTLTQLQEMLQVHKKAMNNLKKTVRKLGWLSQGSGKPHSTSTTSQRIWQRHMQFCSRVDRR